MSQTPNRNAISAESEPTQRDVVARGTAPNVDLSEADPTTPLERDVDQRRIVVAHCVSCGEHDTILAEPGRSHKWHHDQRHPTHVVEYHVEDQEADR